MRNYKEIKFNETVIFDGCTLERFIQAINLSLFGYEYPFNFYISRLDGKVVSAFDQIKTDKVIYKCTKIFYKPNFLLFECTCTLPNFDSRHIAFLIHEDGTQITSMDVIKVEPNYIKKLEEDLKNV